MRMHDGLRGETSDQTNNDVPDQMNHTSSVLIFAAQPKSPPGVPDDLVSVQPYSVPSRVIVARAMLQSVKNAVLSDGRFHRITILGWWR